MSGDGEQRLREQSPRVVALGGSAGALEVLVELLGTIPATLPAAILIVVHLPADGESRLVDVLASECRLPVVEAEDKMPVWPSRVYVAPPDYHLLFERHGRLALAADEPVHFSRPSIDVLFESMAHALGPLACGILLSGASADGAAGLAAIREKGGLTWVQEPETARMPLMPRQALALARHETTTVPEMSRLFADWGNGA
jgi:two-component system chemotaxis response regulator CheB